MARQMPIFSKTYDLVCWLLRVTEHFPRSQRFVVTRRLLDAALDFQELLVEANGLRGGERRQRLVQADAALGKLRLYLRLAMRLEWLSAGQYEHASGMAAEIGRLLGGWLGSNRPSAPPPGA